MMHPYSRFFVCVSPLISYRQIFPSAVKKGKNWLLKQVGELLFF